MQVDNKKQIPVLIALSAILVLAVLYAVKTSLSSGAAAKPAVSRSAQVAQQPSPVQAVAVAPAAGADGTGPSYQFVGDPPRDPFRPELLGASSSQPTNVAVRPNAAAKGATVASNPFARQGVQGYNRQPLPPMPLAGVSNPLSVQGPNGQPIVQGQGAQQTSDPGFTATGVVRGRYDIAIVHSKSGGRYFVRQGQSVGDGYVVKSISPSGVVLKTKDRTVLLTLGEEQDARANSRPRQAGE